MEGSKQAGVSRVDIIGQFIQRVARCNLAASFAIGNPVAFEASADERDTRVHFDDGSRPVLG